MVAIGATELLIIGLVVVMLFVLPIAIGVVIVAMLMRSSRNQERHEP